MEGMLEPLLKEARKETRIHSISHSTPITYCDFVLLNVCYRKK
jgi:hypothetical protein